MLKLKYEKKEEIPVEVSHLYEEKNGMLELIIEGGIPDVQGLKNALESERELHKETGKTLKKVQSIMGELTPERISELVNSEEKFKTSIAQTTDEMANREKQIIEKWEKENSAKDELINGLNVDIEKFVTDSAIHAAISVLKGDPEVLYDPIRKSVKTIRKEGGGFDFQILDSEGKVRVGDNNGGNMSINQRAEEFKQKKGFASAFPTSSGGGGLGNDGKVNNNQNSAEFNKLTPTERMRIHREKTA